MALMPTFSPAWFAAVSGDTYQCKTVLDFADWLDGFSYRARMARQ